MTLQGYVWLCKKPKMTSDGIRKFLFQISTYVQTILLFIRELIPEQIITYKYKKMVDPENTRSWARSIRGYNRETEQQRTTHHPIPARGGTRGYPLWQRRRALRALDANNQYYRLAAKSIGCSKISQAKALPEEWGRHCIQI